MDTDTDPFDEPIDVRRDTFRARRLHDALQDGRRARATAPPAPCPACGEAHDWTEAGEGVRAWTGADRVILCDRQPDGRVLVPHLDEAPDPATGEPDE